MNKYLPKPIPVEAIQVVAPYRGLVAAFRRSHPFKGANGRVLFYHIADAIGQTKAYPGNWVLKHGDGSVEILTDQKFTEKYAEVDANTD